MPRRVVIVGDLPSRPDREAVLRTLSERQPAVEWEWLQASSAAFNVPPTFLSRLVHELREERARPTGNLVVVKLAALNGRDANTVYQVCEPVLSPRELATDNELIDWLLQPVRNFAAAGVPRLPIRAAALLAVSSKLMKNKSFGKDKHSHMWTQEADLLSQAPVVRADLPVLYGEAVGVLGRANGVLFLTKGSNQGKTPKGWCINTAFLPAVKRMLLERSMAPLDEEPALADLAQYVREGREDLIDIDGRIVSERALAECRDRPRE